MHEACLLQDGKSATTGGLASVVCSLDMRRNSHFGENIVASAVQKPFVGLAKARACEACKGLFLVGFNMC